MQFKFFWILPILIILNLIIIFSIKFLFVEDTLFYQSFGDQLTIVKIDGLINASKKWQWTSFVILPLTILIRIFYSSTFLYIGIFFTELKAEFSKLIKISLLGDFMFILSGLAKLIILIFFREINTLEDLQFTPLSILELFDKNSIDPLFIYPLSVLNLFELLYFLVLAWLLIPLVEEANTEEKFGFGQSLKLVAVSYGSGLSLWIALVMFMTLNLS